MKVQYRQGYKYQIATDFEFDTYVFPNRDIRTEYIRLSTDGKLWLKRGYCWDGASGIAVDTKNFMRGSLVHDALYQLIREGHLNRKVWKIKADKELRRICILDGMSKFRAWYVYRAVLMSDYLVSWKQRKIFFAP